MKNLFVGKSSNYSQGELRKRNLILCFTRIILILGFTASILKILISVIILGVNFHMGLQWIPVAILGLLLARFEFWAIGFWSTKYHANGIDWLENGWKDHHDHQTKFFTFKEHKYGQRNPLW